MATLGLGFNDGKFQYLLSRELDTRFDRNLELDDGYLLNHTSSTDVLSRQWEGRRLSIVGLCIDAFGELGREDIAPWLLKEAGTLKELLVAMTRLAGKYVLIYQADGQLYLVGDATSSLPVYYSFEKNGLCASSSAGLTASCADSGLSELAIRARRGSGLDQALPYNITLYDQVFSLLPNYYLDVQGQRAVRYFPTPELAEPERSLDEVVQRSIELIGNVVREYSRYHELVCPLTAGWDSRVVYAFLRREGDVRCYTFRHSRFAADAGELAVPRAICSANASPYQALEVEQAPEAFCNDLKEIIGGFHDRSKVNLAYTYRRSFGDSALINGDIMGQIGKSSLFNAVPAWLSPNSYFVTKTHNYSAAAWKLTGAHTREIKQSCRNGMMFDLFSWENRCGRWAAQSAEVYSACGINMLNIFNCAALIRMWLGVPPTVRVHHRIHSGMLEAIAPDLLDFPCNPDNRIDWLRRNSYLYFLASHVKYGIGGVKHLARA